MIVKRKNSRWLYHRSWSASRCNMMWCNEFINNFKTKTLSIHKITAKLKDPKTINMTAKALNYTPVCQGTTSQRLGGTKGARKCSNTSRIMLKWVMMLTTRYHVLPWPKANYPDWRIQPRLCSQPHRQGVLDNHYCYLFTQALSRLAGVSLCAS